MNRENSLIESKSQKNLLLPIKYSLIAASYQEKRNEDLGFVGSKPKLLVPGKRYSARANFSHQRRTHKHQSIKALVIADRGKHLLSSLETRS